MAVPKDWVLPRPGLARRREKRMVGRRKGEAVRKRINIFSPFLSFYVFLSLLSDNRPTRENKRKEWGEVRQKKAFKVSWVIAQMSENLLSKHCS